MRILLFNRDEILEYDDDGQYVDSAGFRRPMGLLSSLKFTPDGQIIVPPGTFLSSRVALRHTNLTTGMDQQDYMRLISEEQAQKKAYEDRLRGISEFARWL